MPLTFEDFIGAYYSKPKPVGLQVAKAVEVPREERCCYCRNPCEKAKPTGWIEQMLCSNCQQKILFRCIGCGADFTPLNALSWDFCSMECLKDFIKNRQRLIFRDISILKDIGLDEKLMLYQEAANFYLLYDYCIDHPEAKVYLEAKVKYLADQFSTYIFYAICGELRHYKSFHPPLYWWGENDSGKRDYIEEAIASFGGEHNSETRDIVEWFIERGHDVIPREELWQNLSDDLNCFDKLQLIKLAETIFYQGDWGKQHSDIGGQKWGRIAQTLRLYEAGETNNVIFVDSAFGLKHNSNLHFDKAWQVGLTEYVLDFNKANRLDKLRDVASREVRNIIGL